MERHGKCFFFLIRKVSGSKPGSKQPRAIGSVMLGQPSLAGGGSKPCFAWAFGDNIEGKEKGLLDPPPMSPPAFLRKYGMGRF